MNNHLFCLFILLSFVAFISSSSNETETRIKEEVEKWQRSFSGRPVNCIPGQFLFTGNAVLETSNGTKITSLNHIFQHCKTYLEEPFQQLEIFITSPLYFSGYSVSFTRTILLVNHYNCRVPWLGITTLTFTDNFKISKWQDFYDAPLLKEHLSHCDFNINFEEKQEL